MLYPFLEHGTFWLIVAIINWAKKSEKVGGLKLLEMYLRFNKNSIYYFKVGVTKGKNAIKYN